MADELAKLVDGTAFSFQQLCHNWSMMGQLSTIERAWGGADLWYCANKVSVDSSQVSFFDHYRSTLQLQRSPKRGPEAKTSSCLDLRKNLPMPELVRVHQLTESITPKQKSLDCHYSAVHVVIFGCQAKTCCLSGRNTVLILRGFTSCTGLFKVHKLSLRGVSGVSRRRDDVVWLW